MGAVRTAVGRQIQPLFRVGLKLQQFDEEITRTPSGGNVAGGEEPQTGEPSGHGVLDARSLAEVRCPVHEAPTLGVLIGEDVLGEWEGDVVPAADPGAPDQPAPIIGVGEPGRLLLRRNRQLTAVSEETGGKPVETGQRRVESAVDGEAAGNLVVEGSVVRIQNASPLVHQGSEPAACRLKALGQLVVVWKSASFPYFQWRLDTGTPFAHGSTLVSNLGDFGFLTSVTTFISRTCIRTSPLYRTSCPSDAAGRNRCRRPVAWPTTRRRSLPCR